MENRKTPDFIQKGLINTKDLARNELYQTLNDTKLNTNREAWIFGIGHIAKLYVNGFNRINKIRIKGFCVSNPSVLTFEGKNVFSLDNVLQNEVRPLILVCTWQREVYQYVLKKVGGWQMSLV